MLHIHPKIYLIAGTALLLLICILYLRVRLRKSRRKYQTLLENAGDAVVIINDSGKLVHASASIFKVLGYTVKEANGLDVMALAHPDDIAGLHVVMAEVMANPGVPVRGHTGRMMHGDGTWHWYEAVVTNMLHDPDIRGIVDNFRDVSENVHAIEKMNNANRLYAFISQINQAIVHAENQNSVLKETCRIAIECGKFQMAWIGFFNEEGTEIDLSESTGIDIQYLQNFKNAKFSKTGPMYQVLINGEPFICNNISELMLPEWKRFADVNGIKSFMILPIKKNGKTIGSLNLYASKYDFFDEQECRLLEEVVADISFAMNVFERERSRERTEKKNRDSEIRLKQAQSIAHVGSFEIDFATNISTWSEELCRIYGFAIDDNKHHYDKWMEMIHPADLRHVMAIVGEAKSSLSSSAIYHRIIRSDDGSVRYIFSQGEYEFDERGKVIGLHGVAHDITDQKHAELERIKMITDLTQRNKDLEQFSYVVSHNVRAPLANIISLIGLLEHSTLGPDGKEVFDALNESTDKLDYVIKDLNLILNMNRKIDEKKELVTFEELMTDIKIGIANLITAGKAELTSNFSEIGRIHTFKSYLHSIFYNLILNSIKYRKPDTPAMIHVSSKIEKGKLILEFSDNGIGIDLERHQSQLFGLYKRFHPHIEGKGMGLYMVKMQVEQLHGKITVESEVDKGTTFKIAFML
ncbi:GAF domain-containing sensor histidine kinase [Pedobacter psychroterrae]|uniref:histidine kinase n=1 Tax=Pedobacter psychroterrae TaxID=2530453 RepID=A0A4R0NI04_9SPHI|nr:PAS domain S-box protein [Pedobacter psychroterrae]TCC98933.1 PAS domain S-box protein [Pedobacter psychroterrae]